LSPFRFPLLLGGPMVHSFAELVVVHGRPPLTQRSYSLAETGHDPGEMPNFLAHVARLPVPAPAVTTLTPFFCTYYWAFILVSLAKAVRFGEGAMIIIPFPLLCARESLCGARTAALQSTLSVLACLPI